MSTASTIQQYYNAFYGRPADPSGMAFWVNGVNQSGDLIGSAISAFGAPTTPEFSLRFPAGTSTGTFLDTAYGNMFNRTPDAEGKAFWTTAFDNWVGSGRSEGEARALILKNFINAANGQVGTKDKLTITNKLVVADAMTDSVRTYGTESVYLSGLTKAQDLLTGVDYTPTSVTAALARIKFGYVDGVDPIDGNPIIPARIYDLAAYTPSETFYLSSVTEKAILKFSAVGDSMFGWVYTSNKDGSLVTGPLNGGNTVDGIINFASLMVLNFDFNVDKIDVSELGVNSKQYTSLGHRWSDSQLVFSYDENTNTFNLSENWKSYDDFFGNAGIAGIQINTGGGSQTWVFVDTNNNGDLDLGTDGWIILAGVTPSTLSGENFIF